MVPINTAINILEVQIKNQIFTNLTLKPFKKIKFLANP